MKLTTCIVLSLSALIPSLASAANYQAPSCQACALSTPIPDPNTAQALDNYGVPSPFNSATHTYQPGDTIGICNGSACATYTRTDDGQYNKGTAVPETGNGNQCH